MCILDFILCNFYFVLCFLMNIDWFFFLGVMFIDNIVKFIEDYWIVVCGVIIKYLLLYWLY